VSTAAVILTLVTIQRLAELAISRRNTRGLMARGAIEVAPGHYPIIVAVHVSWLIALWTFGHDQPVNVIILSVYLVLQGFRCWVMWTLGSRWTTRVIILPQTQLVTTGPYRLLSHPNYAVVICEIATLPLALGLGWLAAIFTVVNAAGLAIRIRAENRALARTGHSAS